MVLSVNSSSKAILGFATLGALAICTALFYRYRGDASAQTNAPSLIEKSVAILRSNSLVSRVINYFRPTQGTAELPTLSIGDSSNRYTSVQDLTVKLSSEKENYQALDSLIIYGKKLQITQDPGILALNPTKLILNGTDIAKNKNTDSLEQLMITNGWLTSKNKLKIVEVSSVEVAQNAPNAINPETQKPIPTVYRVK